MDGLQARLDSFKKQKRVKNPTKSSSTKSLKWPHPQDFIATPESLADAGFYYDPWYDDPDNVTCFNCGKQLAGWEENDDPYLVHWDKCAQTCCWAVVQCGLRIDMDREGRFVFPDKTRLPNHKTMEKARLESFTLGKGWIHDKTRNHSANSKLMARAGFTYTPQESGDDLVTCLYCNVSLSGWDEDDNPMEEHRKRASKSDTPCPFLEYTESHQTKPPSTKLPSKSSSKPSSRTTSRTKYHETLIPTKTFDGELESESDVPQPRSTSRSTTRESSVKTPAKSRSTSRKSSAKSLRGKSRSASRSGLKNVAEELEDDAKAEAPLTVKKKTRSRSKSVARAGAPPESDVEEEVAKPVQAPPTIKSKARARSKSVARSEAAIQSDGEQEVATTIRKSARSRAKSKAPVEVEEEEEAAPIRKSSRSKSKVAADTKDDVAPPRKASRKSSKPKVVEEESDKAEMFNAKQTRTTTAHKRTGSKSRPRSPEVESSANQFAATVPTTTKATTNAKDKSLSQSRPVNPDDNDLFSEDIVMTDEYLPPPPPIQEQSTIDELPPIFIPKRTRDNGNLPGPSKESDAISAAPSDKVMAKEKRKPGRPPKVKAASEEKPSRPNKVVEVSSDEDEIEKRDHQVSNEAKTKTIEPIDTSNTPSLPIVNGSQDPDQDISEKSQPMENTIDVSMHDAEPATQETVTDADTELHTAPSTPLKPISRSVGPTHSSHSVPSHTLQPSDDELAEVQPSTTSDPPLNLAPEPLYLPPLSRLPFMPLQTLSEAELDMTVEEWIRYQIEVEQDRFKRDGERELERFKKRAEEVRSVIEGL